MRGFQRWACVCAVLLLLLGPATGAALAAPKPFEPPVDAEVSRKFEAPSHKFGPGHRGIDYAVPSGTTVGASGEGTVTFAGQVADDGLFVTIEHAGGISTTYSFLSRVDVSKGHRVSQGQPIGLSGEGHPEGPAGLHFGAKKNGDYIDPEMLLKALDDITDLLALAPVLRSTAAASASGQFVDRPLSSGVVAASVAPDPEALAAAAVPSPPPRLPIRVGASASKAEPLRTPFNSVWVNELELAPTELSPSGGNGMAEWWRSQTPEVRKALIAQDPKAWARKDFVSAADRDAINRSLLDQKIRELERHRRSLAGRREVRLNSGWIAARAAAFPLAIRSAFDREAEIDRKLRTAKALRDQLAAVTDESRNRLRADDVYLLDFDTDFAGGDGKAVVALGDPGTADHIGVVVPGINNAVGTIEGGINDAAILRAEVHRSIDRDLVNRTSTIVWMGYDNPNGLQDAINRGEAQEGAPLLKSFVDSLKSGHAKSPVEPHVTVFGHSYGSAVTGIAALDGMDADDVVFYGSPGVGKHFVDAGDFSQRVWAARSWTDPIALTMFALGSDPATLNFGAGRIPVDPFLGHSDYIVRGSTATINFAKILTGRLRHVPKENR